VHIVTRRSKRKPLNKQEIPDLEDKLDKSSFEEDSEGLLYKESLNENPRGEDLFDKDLLDENLLNNLVKQPLVPRKEKEAYKQHIRLPILSTKAKLNTAIQYTYCLKYEKSCYGSFPYKTC